MARDRQIPSFFASVDRKRKIPVRAILLVALLSTAIGILALAKSDLVTSIVTFGSLTAYVLLHVAVMRVFCRDEEDASPGSRMCCRRFWASPSLIYARFGAHPSYAKIISGIWLAVGVGIYMSRKMLSSDAAA